MQSLGKLLVPVVMLTSTVYAGGEANRYFEQDSFDSIGEMVLEANREASAVPARRAQQISECQAKEKELEARMASLGSLLALSDQRLEAIKERVAAEPHKSYKKTLKSLTKQLTKAEKQREAMREALSRYRAMIGEKQVSDKASAATAAVLADVEEALAQAEAALAGAY